MNEIAIFEAARNVVQRAFVRLENHEWGSEGRHGSTFETEEALEEARDHFGIVDEAVWALVIEHSSWTGRTPYQSLRWAVVRLNNRLHKMRRRERIASGIPEYA